MVPTLIDIPVHGGKQTLQKQLNKLVTNYNCNECQQCYDSILGKGRLLREEVLENEQEQARQMGFGGLGSNLGNKTCRVPESGSMGLE